LSQPQSDKFEVCDLNLITLELLGQVIDGEPLFGPPSLENISLLGTAFTYPSIKCHLVDIIKDHRGNSSVTVAYQFEQNVMKILTLSPDNWISVKKNWDLLAKLRTRLAIFENQADLYGMDRYEIWKFYLDKAGEVRKQHQEQEKYLLTTLRGFDT